LTESLFADGTFFSYLRVGSVYSYILLSIQPSYCFVISPLQSTAGHRPLQLFSISLDLRQLASSSRQPSCVNRHSTWHESGHLTLRLPRRGLHSRTRLPQRLSVLRLIWPAHCHFSTLIRCAMSVTLVLCRITWFQSVVTVVT
jgi:hypothetical protein